MRLVLFDIDGTILRTKGAGRQAIKRALEEVYGAAGPVDAWPFGGKTDPLICYELMAEVGLSRAEVDAKLDEAIARYLCYLEAELSSTATSRLMPGIIPLLESLARDERVTLGLLTGNVKPGARLKLARHGLTAYFRLGAYGCDHFERRELPAVAVERARALTGRHFQGKEVVIIGDTPADVACGRGLGVRAIAVATGAFRLEDLQACAPDFAFETLEGTAGVLDAIFRPA